MSVFTFSPGHGTQVAYKPKNHKAAFGDGYTQVIPKGINNNPKVWTLEFPNLDDYTKEQMRAFMKGVAGGTPFQWTDLDGELLWYRCEDYGFGYTEEDENSMHAVFEQYFG